MVRSHIIPFCKPIDISNKAYQVSLRTREPHSGYLAKCQGFIKDTRSSNMSHLFLQNKEGKSGVMGKVRAETFILLPNILFSHSYVLRFSVKWQSQSINHH